MSRQNSKWRVGIEKNFQACHIHMITLGTGIVHVIVFRTNESIDTDIPSYHARDYECNDSYMILSAIMTSK